MQRVARLLVFLQDAGLLLTAVRGVAVVAASQESRFWSSRGRVDECRLLVQWAGLWWACMHAVRVVVDDVRFGVDLGVRR